MMHLTHSHKEQSDLESSPLGSYLDSPGFGAGIVIHGRSQAPKCTWELA